MSRLLPDVLAVRRDEPDAATVRLVVDLSVPSALAHFSGHFPGLPILPGVVQVDWAVRLASEHLAVSGDFSMLENVKFQALVLPDARLALTLAWDADNRRLEFAYATSQRKYSSGRIVFGGAA